MYYHFIDFETIQSWTTNNSVEQTDEYLTTVYPISS